jgi:integrase
VRKRLTDIVVTRTKAPEEGQLDIFDTVLPCFGVRIGARKRTYFVTYRFGGKRRRMTIGDAKRMSLGDAKRRADEALDLVEKGIDPQASPTCDKPTFGEAVEMYLAAPDARKRWQPVNIPEKLRSRRQQFATDALPAWSDRPLDEVAWADVRCLIDDVHRRAPIAANRQLALLKHFFGWCLKRRLITASPCADIDKPAPEAARDRTLSEAEVRRFWAATEEQGGDFRDVFRLQLVTAQRRGEVLGMRWREVDLDAMTWTIPAERAKNGRAHEVALTGLAVEILAARSREDTLVFPSVKPRRGNEGRTALSGYHKAKRRVVDAMGVGDGVRFHDLRRTATTMMAEMGVPPQVVDRGLLNHKSGTIRGVAAVYNKYEYAKEARDALLRWEARLRAIVGSAPPGVNDVPSAPAVPNKAEGPPANGRPLRTGNPAGRV